MNTPDFNSVTEFEWAVADFFGAPYAVATDSCTHAIELCLRFTDAKIIDVPKRTYVSIPMLSNKLGIDLSWNDNVWNNYYYLTPEIADAAVFWQMDGYVSGKYMCLSFQYQKHLSLGRGGMILLDDKEAYYDLKKMSYDGREPGIPWRDQNISCMGYHYYMTPETASLGLQKLPEAIVSEPRQWNYEDWPILTEMDIFK